MKKVNKILSVAFALCLGISCFAGCKDSNNNEKANSFGDGIGASIGILVDERTSDYSIVVSEIATITETTAARELQAYLYDITGAMLPIASDVSIQYDDSSKIISVGETKILDGLRKMKGSGFDTIDYNALNGCGFIIKTHGNSIFMDGADDRGTLYSVYDYLEKICGVKYLAADYEYIPQISTIDFYELDIIERPAFRYRSYMTGTSNAKTDAKQRFETASPDFGSATEMSTLWLKIKGYDQNHNVMAYVPTSEYYTQDKKQANAHMYARGSEVEIPDQPKEICWTDGITEDGKIDESMEISAVKVALESMKKFALQDTDAKYFMFGQEDNVPICQCNDCVAASEKYTRCGMAVRFGNILATEIQNWANAELNGREINVVIFAYQYSGYAPVSKNEDGKYEVIDLTCKAVENLYIRVATDAAYLYYPINDKNQPARYEDYTEKWGAVGSNFMVWAYGTNWENRLTYFPTIQAYSRDFQDYEAMGVEYMMIQDTHNATNHWQGKLKLYVASKMMWNPKLNPMEIRNEFVHYYFGPAEEEINTFLTELDEFFITIPEFVDVTFTLYEEKLDSYEVWDSAQLWKYVAQLDKAIKTIESSEISQSLKAIYIDHVKLLKTTPLCLLLINYDTYYLNDRDGKLEVAKEFFALWDYFEMRHFGIDETLNAIRMELGI